MSNEPHEQFCPNLACCDSGKVGAGNISIHNPRAGRCRCKTCKKSFSAAKGTALCGLKKDVKLFILVITLGGGFMTTLSCRTTRI